MQKLDIDSSARLIHEAIQQLGWNTDSTSLVDRVKRLDLGLPAEDEFAFLLSWFGKCSLVHKLNQKQFPPISRRSYQVPDLFACFKTNAGLKPVLIEIKVSKKKKLSWKVDYVRKLKEYSSLIGLPVLIAWKFHRIWSLVEIECFVKARTNYHLSFETAMKHNLMSFLAGDFVYIMKPNVGLHFILKKERLVEEKILDTSSREEQWLARVEEAYFTNSEGRKSPKLPSGLWPLFISSEPISQNQVESDRIYQSFIITEDSGMQFAHAALPVLINFSMDNDEKIHWRKHLEDHKYPVDFSLFSEAAKKGIEEGFVRYILYQQPVTIPSFLKDLEMMDKGINKT